VTQHMTKADLIRSMPDLTATEVARRIGVDAQHVRKQRWTDANYDRHLEHVRRSQSKPESRERKRARDNAHLAAAHAEGFGAIATGRWRPSDDKQLIKLIRAGKSYTECGKAFRVTRNCVAGRVHRLRQEGRL